MLSQSRAPQYICMVNGAHPYQIVQPNQQYNTYIPVVHQQIQPSVVCRQELHPAVACNNHISGTSSYRLHHKPLEQATRGYTILNSVEPQRETSLQSSSTLTSPSTPSGLNCSFSIDNGIDEENIQKQANQIQEEEIELDIKLKELNNHKPDNIIDQQLWNDKKITLQNRLLNLFKRKNEVSTKRRALNAAKKQKTEIDQKSPAKFDAKQQIYQLLTPPATPQSAECSNPDVGFEQHIEKCLQQIDDIKPVLSFVNVGSGSEGTDCINVEEDHDDEVIIIDYQNTVKQNAPVIASTFKVFVKYAIESSVETLNSRTFTKTKIPIENVKPNQELKNEKMFCLSSESSSHVETNVSKNLSSTTMKEIAQPVVKIPSSSLKRKLSSSSDDQSINTKKVPKSTKGIIGAPVIPKSTTGKLSELSIKDKIPRSTSNILNDDRYNAVVKDLKKKNKKRLKEEKERKRKEMEKLKQIKNQSKSKDTDKQSHNRKNSSQKRVVPSRKGIIEGMEFFKLGDKIKQKPQRKSRPAEEEKRKKPDADPFEGDFMSVFNDFYKQHSSTK